MRLASLFVMAAGCALAVGCGDGGPRTAAVSGRVTLNGRPLPHAVVYFQPIAGPDRINPGPPSQGRTDAEGRYSLRVLNMDREGAVVGPCRVQISAFEGEPNPKVESTEPPRPLLPPRYNTRTELTFDIPSGGTDKADFSLTVP